MRRSPEELIHELGERIAWPLGGVTDRRSVPRAFLYEVAEALAQMDAALQPFAALVTPASYRDDTPVWGYNGAIITHGDLRRARAVTASPIEVVAAVRQRGDRYWVCQRSGDGAHGGLEGMWEFPGGKIEHGETHQQALKREMREEFGSEVVVERHLDSITTPTGERLYRVHFYRVLFYGEPELRVHRAQTWATVAELREQQHLPSGVEFIRGLP